MEKKIKFLMFGGLALTFVICLLLMIPREQAAKTDINAQSAGENKTVTSNSSADLPGSISLGQKSAVNIQKAGHNYYYPAKKNRIVDPFDDELDPSNEMFQQASLPGKADPGNEKRIELLPRNMDPSELDNVELTESGEMDSLDPDVRYQ